MASSSGPGISRFSRPSRKRQIRQRRTVRFHLEESAVDDGAAGEAEVEGERGEVTGRALPQVEPAALRSISRARQRSSGSPRLERAAEAAPLVGKEDRWAWQSRSWTR